MMCVEYLEEDVTVETACTLFEEGRKLLNETQFGIKFIEENATDVVQTPGFLNLSRDCLTVILKSSNLTINEVDLFEAVEKWGEGDCKRQGLKPTPENKRTVLGELLNLIRFPDMSMQEVCTKVQGSGLLTADELLSLFTYLGASKDNKPKIKFPTKPREGGGLFVGSTLLSIKQQQILNKFYSKEGRQRWDLIYKGKTHGMDGYTFHSRCDTAGPTLTVIRSSGTQYLFGGFTEQSWSGSGYKGDMKAFLFSIVNARNTPCKLVSTNTTYSISCQSGNGPCFGGGHNIYIAGQMTSNSNYCNVHESYRMETSSVLYTQDLFAGSYNFTVEDIEVFSFKKKT